MSVDVGLQTVLELHKAEIEWAISRGATDGQLSSLERQQAQFLEQLPSLRECIAEILAPRVSP